MAFGRRKQEQEEIIVDSTAWMLTSEIAQILLLHTPEIKYMAMLAYTFLHGTGVSHRRRQFIAGIGCYCLLRYLQRERVNCFSLFLTTILI